MDCPAHQALAAEGISHDVLICTGTTGYAMNLSTLWGMGEGFVLVEHDVVPWPGAVQELTDCESDWCRFRYPKGGRLIRSLGCCKFSERLTKEHPGLPERWQGEPWWTVENSMLLAVSQALSGESCTHSPPVAHVKAA